MGLPNGPYRPPDSAFLRIYKADACEGFFPLHLSVNQLVVPDTASRTESLLVNLIWTIA